MVFFFFPLEVQFLNSLEPGKSPTRLFHGLRATLRGVDMGSEEVQKGHPRRHVAFIIRWIKGGKEALEGVSSRVQNLSVFTKCSLI